MLYQLQPERYAQMYSLFSGLSYELIIRAVLDGSSPGVVHANHQEHPACGFISSAEGWFLAGDSQDTGFITALRRHLAETVFTAERGEFTVAVTPESWVAVLPDLVSHSPLLTATRRHYSCRAVRYDWRANTPAGYTVELIDQELLERPGLQIPAHIPRWMQSNWGSKEAFLQSGLGCCTINNNEVVSWSLADCISEGQAEIGIHTAPAYRQRGLAALTAAATVEQCLARGLSQVGWHCGEQNTGSWKTAEKVGFEHDLTYRMYYCEW